MAEHSLNDPPVADRNAELVGISRLKNGTSDAVDDCEVSSPDEPITVPPKVASWSIFKNAQWSPDGTTVLSSNADNSLNTFVLPADLLDVLGPHSLQRYATHKLPSPVYATAFSPMYSLSMPESTLFLASVASLPIRLYSPFAPDIIASYPLVNHMTEAYIAPHSLLYDTYGNNGNYFFAGSESQISVFDISRNGEGPMQEMKTIPSRRKKIVGGGVGMKGIVSSLAMSGDGMLAAGTFTRWIGLYDGGGRGGMAGVFELGKNEEDEARVGEGAGITQVVWSQCGRYLCVAERGSDGVGVWDIRGTGKRLCWLEGRTAQTMQRLGIDLAGKDLWAGGKDGMVRLWQDIGSREGVLKPDWAFLAHEDAVSSATTHPCGSILATCSGQRHQGIVSNSNAKAEGQSSTDTDEVDDSEAGSSDSGSSRSSRSSVEDDSRVDNTLKIWTL